MELLVVSEGIDWVAFAWLIALTPLLVIMQAVLFDSFYNKFNGDLIDAHAWVGTVSMILVITLAVVAYFAGFPRGNPAASTSRSHWRCSGSSSWCVGEPDEQGFQDGWGTGQGVDGSRCERQAAASPPLVRHLAGAS